MKKNLLGTLLVCWSIHLALWFVSDQYRYGVYSPSFMTDVVARFLGYRQIEDLPDAKAIAVLICGFWWWGAAAIALMTIMRPFVRGRKR